MIIVSEIFTDIQQVLGTCDETITYNKLNEAIEELANLGNWDPMTVSLDICTEECEITLPDDIEVPLAINVGGRPADFRNKWFEYHANGPGSECCSGTCSFSWQDQGEFPTFRSPIRPSTISTTPEMAETETAIRVYGYDENDRWIMEADSNGVMQDGFSVPIIFGFGSGLTTSQLVKRITRIAKPVTNGFLQINAIDPGSSSGGTLLGIIRPNITNPSFRRIKVSGSGTELLSGSASSCRTWVRMRARKKTFKVSSLDDAIPLDSVTALKMMCMAIKKYEADLAGEYKDYLNMAREAMQRQQKTASGPNQIKIQFQNGSYTGRPGENMI